MLKKKVIFDGLLNIIATAIPIVILQLIALPIVGIKLGEVEYGIVVTLISLYTLLSFPIGNVLNNIRLIQHNEYRENNINGDFNVLLVIGILISSFIVSLGTVYYEGSFSAINIIFMIMITILNLAREYLIVYFRIHLNYKAILLNNVILGIGYLFGILIFYFTGYWQLIFLLGVSFSFIYIARNTNLLKEKFSITKLFKATTYKSFILFISIFLKNILSYADKLLLFPLLGPTAVSIYYASTILGKTISMGITPLNSVVLSYLVRMEKLKLKSFIFTIIYTILIGVVGYIAVIVISPFVLNVLYPLWADESLELIYVTTASAIIGVLSGVINPFILRFTNINYQIVISATNVILYIVFTILFYNMYGLLGFCIGVLIANILKFVLMIFIFVYNYHRNNKKEMETVK